MNWKKYGIGLVLVCLLFASCKQLDSLVLKPTAPPAVIGTNIVITPSPMDGVPAVTNYYPILASPEYTVNPIATGAATVISGLPIPFAGTASLVLTTLLGLYSSYRNKKIAVGVIQSVDAARIWLRQTPEGIKADAGLLAVIEKHQEEAKIYNAVSSLVDKYTGKTIE
jgi:hypothetical protein